MCAAHGLLVGRAGDDLFDERGDGGDGDGDDEGVGCEEVSSSEEIDQDN